MTTTKKRFLNQLLVFLTVLTVTIVSCEKKVYAPGVEDQGQNTTSSSTTSSSTTSSSTTSGTTGSTTSSTTKTLTFWSNFQGSPIEVTVNGVYKGQVTSVLSSAPSCGASGCVSVNFSSSGNVSYTATDGTYNWSGTTNISSTCTTLLLHI
jgi:hypothetical protein